MNNILSRKILFSKSYKLQTARAVWRFEAEPPRIAHTNTHTHTYTHTHIHTRTYIYIYARVCVCVYVRTCVCSHYNLTLELKDLSSNICDFPTCLNTTTSNVPMVICR